MFKAMDRRKVSHVRGRKLQKFLSDYEKEKIENEKWRKIVAKERSDKIKRENEMNILWLAQISTLNAEKSAVIQKCPGCKNCCDSEKECFTVLLNKE